MRYLVRLFALLLFASFGNIAFPQEQKTIPIIAYGGVPHYSTTAENYRRMRECGFDVGITNFDSLDEMISALEYAAQNNIKIIGDCPELRKNPEETSGKLKEHPALLGYFIEDEPNAERIRELSPLISRLKENDEEHFCYINLLPWYDKGQFHSLKAKSYSEYVRSLVNAGSEIISFDIYPIQESGIRPSWYENLEFIRQESLRANIPFWAFVLSTPHFEYLQPTMEQLRLQIYSNLAYGAQGIQYFTYWTPPAHDKYDYHNGPVDSKGNKTTTYAIVQAMNAELKKVGQLFCGARVLSVNHIGKLPAGASRLSANPLNITKLSINRSGAAIVSQFSKDGHLYAAIVNRNYNKNLTVKLKSNKIPVRITKDLRSEPLKNEYVVYGGDILILKLD